jgi:hypothetical protein
VTAKMPRPARTATRIAFTEVPHVCAGQQLSDRDETQPLALAGDEYGIQGAQHPRWIGDAIVQDHDGARGEVLGHKPANVPGRGARRVVGIGRTEDAPIPVLGCESQLGVPNQAAGRAIQLHGPTQAKHSLRAEEVGQELAVRCTERRADAVVVVSDLVATAADRADEGRVGSRTIPNQEERCASAMLGKKGQDPRGMIWSGPVVEGQRDQRRGCLNPPQDARVGSGEQPEQPQGLDYDGDESDDHRDDEERHNPSPRPPSPGAAHLRPSGTLLASFKDAAAVK